MNNPRSYRVVFGVGACGMCLGLLGCSAPEVEQRIEGTTEQALTLPGVTLQTVLVPHFVGAANNGGGAVNATATVAQGWETFTLQDINGGSLMSGDSVFIQAGNGQFFQALNGGGSSLNAGSNNQLGWETFKVVKQSGSGAISNGDIIGLQDNAGSWVSAASGGGGAVFAYGGALGSWEQFKINGLPAVVTPPTPPSNNPVTVSNVSIRAILKNTFVGATSGGGSTVVATATTAQGWETFSLIDVNGGSLVSGDSVYVEAGNGQYFQALNGGGSSLNAGSNSTQGWETFKLVKQSGTGTVNTGDIVGLQASTGSWVSAENGGGGTVFAYGGALGSWESFAIGIGAPSQPPPPPPPTGCDAPGLAWKSANKTNFTSYPDPGSDECIKYSGCMYEGQFAACNNTESKAWVQAHNIVSVFPNLQQLALHDLCLKSGSKTIVVTVLDECADSDCSGCCTQNKGSADELIDIESFTDARFGVADGAIQWADLGPTKTSGCN